ncbi:glycoside hydrolase family 88 protein [Pseudonocardia acaciae]|uniref:glycoside hydrolase family 88 protein n=1 Tax=Pseudonocardia acaciae TaxID=551276 RepID=UPI0004902ACA|nr:glycoside hydrolase family 88 protein [Pseudonocardia acaciae]
MTGEDLANARLAAPPRPPLPETWPTREALAEMGDRVAARTWELGLPHWFWGEGVCLLGLIRLASALGRPFPPDVLDWLRAHAATGVTVAHVNHLAPGAALAMAPAPELSPLLAELAGWVHRPGAATRDAAGTLEHWPGGIWADTVFMAGVFLGHAGVRAADPTLLREFADQLVGHAAVLQDPATGLYAHGSHRGEVIRCFWGRANAWTALAAVEFLELATAPGAELANPLSAQVASVRDSLRRQLTALAARQPAHGVWSVLVDDHPEVAGLLETSAAAGIGAAMLRAAAVVPDLPPEVTAAGWRAVRGALAYVEPDGTLARTSAGTVLQLVPFGYSVIRDDLPQPWGQGLALHAIAAALASPRSRP